MNTYEQILALMTDKYTELTGIRPDDASDVGIRMKVLAYQIYSLESSLSQLEMQLMPQTAQGEYLDKHAAQRGIVRKMGYRAKGEVTFTRNSLYEGEIAIPEGVIVSTLGEDSVRYEVERQGALAPGQNSITLPVACIGNGTAGNAAADKVKIVITPISGIDSITNSAPLTGGTDSETDEALRDRLFKSYSNISNGTNAAYYLEQALGYPGIGFAGVIPRSRGRGTVDILVHGDTGTASPSALSGLEERIEQKREVNVDVAVIQAAVKQVNIAVEIAHRQGFNPATVNNEVQTLVTAYANSLSVGKALYTSSIVAAVMKTEGVANCKVSVDGTDIYPLATEIVRPGTVTVTTMQISGG